MTLEQGKSTRTAADWIDSFLKYTEGIPSPEIFRLWSGIAALAGVMERRIWMNSLGEKLFPNLYVLLVSPPGVGKTQAIKAVHALWKKVSGIQVAPDSMTRAALFDELEKSKRQIILSPVQMEEYNSMQIAADELGVFISGHDLEFLSYLNKVFDNPPVFDESRRMFQGKNKIIHNPQLNILAGTQPGFMASVLPEEAWSMGFTSRLIMVYSGTPVHVELFSEVVRNDKLREQLESDLNAMMKLYGPMKIEQEAKDELKAWHSKKMPPVPEHSKLEHYNTRRILYLLKLCQIASISRSSELVIRLPDFHRALTWLLQAESTMPDIFRNMSQKSDALIIQELHFMMWQLYAKNKKPIHESILIHFLSAKAPSDKIEKIINMAERAKVIIREAGSDLYRPNTKEKIGVE